MDTIGKWSVRGVPREALVKLHRARDASGLPIGTLVGQAVDAWDPRRALNPGGDVQIGQERCTKAPESSPENHQGITSLTPSGEAAWAWARRIITSLA